MHVEIWSDIACPWCAVGKRRFEKALEQFEHAGDVTVTFRSFELDPEAPAAREGSTAENLAKKYGTSLEQAQAMNARMTETAAEDGLTFRFDIAKGGNTFDAHRLLHLAAAHGRQHELKERLMRGYLGEGELMSDHAALTRLALSIVAAVSVAASPVVPHGTSPFDPSSICHSTSSRNAASLTRPAANGVTSAGIDPKNMKLFLRLN